MEESLNDSLNVQISLDIINFKVNHAFFAPETVLVRSSSIFFAASAFFFSSSAFFFISFSQSILACAKSLSYLTSAFIS